MAAPPVAVAPEAVGAAAEPRIARQGTVVEYSHASHNGRSWSE